MHRIILLVVIFTLLLSKQASAVSWTQGKGLEGGIVNCIHIDKYDNIFAGTSGGCIYISADEGESWTRILDYNLDLCEMKSIMVSGNRDIYAAGHEYIYKSSDYGNSWTRLEKLTDDAVINKIVCASDGKLWAATSEGLYYSEDEGMSWKYDDLDFMGLLEVYTVGIDHEGTIHASTNKGIHYLLEGEFRWELWYESYRVKDFAFDKEGNMHGYGSYFRLNAKKDTARYGGLFDADRIYSITVDSDSDIYFGTDDGIIVSKDKGYGWKDCSFGLENSEVFALSCTSSGKLLAGTNGGGIYRSNKNSIDWFRSNSGFATVITDCFQKNRNGIVFAGTKGDGIYSSSDNGLTWKSVLSGRFSNQVTDFDESPQGVLYASTFDGIFRSDNGGRFWYKVTEDKKVQFLSILADDNGNVYTGTYLSGIYRSTDGGESWESFSKGIKYGSILKGLQKLKNGDILVATAEKGIYRLNKNEEKWTESTGEISYSGFENMTLDKDGNIFLCMGRNGILRSSDNGYNWELVTDDNYSFLSIQIDKSGNIYTGTLNNGVLKSSDGAATWEVIGDKSEMPVAAGLFIDREQRLFAGTGYGVYVTDEPVGIEENRESGTDQLNIYPNPAGELINLRMKMIDSGPVRIVFHDPLGNIVLNQIVEITDGAQNIPINTSGLSSGFYFLEITAGDKVYSKSVLILK